MFFKNITGVQNSQIVDNIVGMMKRKADESVEEADVNAPRKRAAVELIEKGEHFRNGLFDRKVSDTFTKNYSESKP